MALRLFWWRLDKAPVIALAVVAGLVAGVSGVIYTMTAAKSERQQLTCLALNIYFEARGEPEAGQYAVAEVTLNRVASPHYPDTVCAVVYQQNWDPIRRRKVGAFSWTEQDLRPEPKGPEWRRARHIATQVYYRQRPPALAGALHYHADYVAPGWSQGRTPIAKIGNHLFYP